MKRLSLLLVASAFLMTTSGCCCGLFHGCNSCGYPSCGCGYQPGYPAYPAYPVAPGCSTCPTCPTCPSGGCGVNAPVYPQGAFYEGDPMSRAALTSNVGYGATPAEALASAQQMRTF